jgi:phospholipid/cholesterol/gamma-HCH transport system ATP-binding protein
MMMGAPQVANAEDQARAALTFEGAVLPLEDRRSGPTVGLDLRLMPGDLALIDPADEAHERAVADAARGLSSPLHGEVRFLGRSWSGLSADHANALRGRIGHTFRRTGWIPYLSVMDNVMLGERYHTRRPAAEIRDEGARLAAQFGLPGLPTGHPGDVAAPELQRAAHLSAFLGRPALLVLESPLGGLVPGLLAPLMNAIRGARDRHATVLWFVQERELRDDPSLPATHRLRLQGDAFVPTETTW